MMFTKLSVLATVIPFVSAVTFTTPSDWHAGSEVTVSWQNEASDPSTWTLELQNPSQFHNALALVNSVNASAGQLNLTLGIVPADNNYFLQAVNVTNIGQVFGQSTTFAIANPISSTSSTAASTSSGSLSSASGTVSAPASSTSGFGITVSPSSGAQSSSNSGATSGSGTSSSGNAGPSPTDFNGGSSGAIANGLASWVPVVFAAAAGAVVAL